MSLATPRSFAMVRDHDANLDLAPALVQVIGATDRRPLAIGYIRRHSLMTDSEQESLTAALSSFADASGLRLGEVFVETDESLPRRFGAVIDAIQRDVVIAILAPGEEHLHSLGGTDVVRHRLARFSARLLLLTTPQTDEVGS